MPSTSTVARMGTREMRSMARSMTRTGIRAHIANTRRFMSLEAKCNRIHCWRMLAVLRAELHRRQRP